MSTVDGTVPTAAEVEALEKKWHRASAQRLGGHILDYGSNYKKAQSAYCAYSAARNARKEATT
jgi:hypothetical protein